MSEPVVRVLAVDDCPDTRTTLALLLRLWGYEVRLASEGPSALQVWQDFRPQPCTPVLLPLFLVEG